MRVTTERAIAFHESGHAITCYLVGAGLRGVTMFDPEVWHGNTFLKPQHGKRLDWVRILLAGGCAQAIGEGDTTFLARGVNDRRFKEHGATEDYRHAVEALAKDCPKAEIDARLGEVVASVYEMLTTSNVRQALDALAGHLIENGAMTGEEIETWLDATPLKQICALVCGGRLAIDIEREHHGRG